MDQIQFENLLVPLSKKDEGIRLVVSCSDSQLCEAISNQMASYNTGEMFIAGMEASSDFSQVFKDRVLRVIDMYDLFGEE